ncbi:ArnT family glycosyltransferase [Granulosicoccus antarcticus]|uniref:Undecaprenyl phosphate-alpha-4-amino-4-deoxy-L-arabinose arabinosyl transferase n=1 Tax=Granulosicoccus antarcticus IMCC3135 TaxID=1192854 RepID=A0A2Z2NIC9_9GAMM|nr:glycosyltransferase family 39 protein [Granulosicoccus antarcticus]ASJ70813.1 Undecaprenyl phosphate-alpha-4-amino-4-deoxy-L-arabinose arabinosyl transferase [Granulosicoccus antarcticus IMCC3135]
MNTRMENNTSALWWILGLAALLFLAGLGLRDPWPADEPRFAQVAREMVQSGQWLFPTRGGEFYSDKPPVFMWAIASIYWLTDNLRVAFLLPSALCSLLTVWLMHDLALRLWDRKIAIHASLLLLATLQFVLQAKTAQIDAMVASLIMLACYGLLRHLIQGNALGWYLLGWFAMGLGVITKGVGFLPVFLILPWVLLLLAGGRQQLAKPSWWLLAGVPCFLFAIALWVVPMSLAVNAAGDPALDAYRNDILFRQTGTRYANAWAHVKPFYYYLVSVIPVLWLPTILLLPGLIAPWGRAFRGRDPRIVMPLIWILIVLVFFSASPGKRGVYLLPLVPMLCLATAPFLAALLERRWVALIMRGLLAFLAVLFIGVAVAAFAGNASLLEAEIEHGFAPWNLILTVGLIAFVAAVLCRSGDRVAMAWAVFIVPFWLLYSTWAYSLVNADRTPAAVMNAVEAITDEQATVALVDFREQYLLFSHRKITHFGYNTPAAMQLAEAWQWQGEAGNRYVLLADDRLLDCFDPSKAVPVGRAHGHDWRLYADTARKDSCATPEPTVVRYNYWQPGALR